MINSKLTINSSISLKPSLYFDKSEGDMIFYVLKLLLHF
nr:MAG TPA: Ssty Spin/Ssty Family [Caudoviricetes sp.]